MGQGSHRVARWRPSRFHRWAIGSAAVHLVALLILVPALEREPELETRVVTEVDLVDRKPERKKAEKQPGPKQRRQARARRKARRRKRARPASPVQQRVEQQPSELLLMREPDPEPQEETVPPPEKQRFSSFWSRDPRPVRAPASRRALGSLEVTRYADGGRTLRGSDGQPDPAAMGLLDLAAGRLGRRTGSQACNPYRGWRGTDRRELILMVDTSGSVVRSRRAPASLVCAAGAALAALDRGIPVTVINFSSITQRYGPTRDIEVVYRALSTFQAQGTVLPRPGLLELSRGGPRDLVLISDTAIHNLEDVLPEYGKMLRADPRNRALLYYLGGQPVEGMDPAKALELIRRTGFRAEQVDRLWADS